MAILGMEFQAKLKDTKVASELAFPRDGTSLGQTRMGRPIVPLSRDKKNSCPGVPVAGANVPGQTLLSRDVPGQNHFPKRTKKQEMYIQKQEKDILKQERTFQNSKGHFKTGKDVLKQEIIEKNSDCPVPVLSWILTKK